MNIDEKYSYVVLRIKRMLKSNSIESLASNIRGSLLNEKDDWALLALSVLKADRVIDIITEVQDPSKETLNKVKKHIADTSKKFNTVYRPSVMNDPLSLEVYKTAYRFVSNPGLDRYIQSSELEIHDNHLSYLPEGRIAFILPYGLDWLLVVNINGRAVHMYIRNHGLETDTKRSDVFTIIPYKKYCFEYKGVVYEIINGHVSETPDAVIKSVYKSNKEEFSKYELFKAATNITTGQQEGLNSETILPFNRGRSF